MIIGIDGNEANVSQRVGVGWYAYELLWSLYRLQDIKNHKNTFIIYLKNPPTSDFPKENIYWRYKIISGESFWVLTKLMPALLTTEKMDVFFSPSHYLPLLSRSPKVFLLHDLGYLKFSEQFKKYDYWQLKYWTAISIIVSKYIISPSKSTANDIVRHYPFVHKKVKIVPHGYDEKKFNQNIPKFLVRQITKKYRISKDYILFLSTLKPSKNIEGLLEAYKIILERSISNDVLLVIAGKKGWLFESIFDKTKSLGLEKKVIFTDYIPEDEKPAIIAGAKIFVLPSFWEGFGIDLLSAMACGVPVVVSKSSSISEVVGEAGVFFNPYDSFDIANAIEKVLKMNSKEYTSLVKKGFRQVQKFSWEKTAKETLKVLEMATKDS